ncbi:MAG TPA: ester cyclase [Acetobacteraceae bacterium]|nr:ester cyclase [Acetobacteraceae bacterium]
MIGIMPDGRYDLKSFAIDEARKNVSVFATFHATHTGEGGPCPPTGKSTATDYVYVMHFDGDKIKHMTKVWNAGYAMKELGWA